MKKKLKLESDWDDRDLYGAFLELCARKMEFEVLKIYSPEDIIERVHMILGKTIVIPKGIVDETLEPT